MGDIEMSDPHAIAMAARSHVTEEQLAALRGLVDSAYCVPDTARCNSYAHVDLAAAGLADCARRDDQFGPHDYYTITEAGRCLLAMDGRERSGGV